MHTHAHTDTSMHSHTDTHTDTLTTPPQCSTSPGAVKRKTWPDTHELLHSYKTTETNSIKISVVHLLRPSKDNMNLTALKFEEIRKS